MAVFDRAAEHYDGWYETVMGSFVDRVETELAFGLFKLRQGMKVLDVGCGTGNYSLKLAKSGCRVTGVDISESMLRFAKDKARSEGLSIDYAIMDAYRLGFGDESFDGVICMTAIEFMDKPEVAVREFLRVVKKGGQVLVGTITADSAWGAMYMSEDSKEDSVFQYAKLRTLDELRRLAGDRFVLGGECLFVPPDADEADFCIEKERELAATERGGFACALWIK